MVNEIIEPPSELQDIALILSIILCFVLILVAIWFVSQHSLGPAFFSMTGAAFIVFVIWALKGAFRK
jgi:uncharacterized membrane protein (DUF373 family)